MLRIGIISAPPPSAFFEGEEQPQGAAFDVHGQKEALKLLHGRGSGRNAMKKINV